MADRASDNQWVIDYYKANEGRNPTQAELEDAVNKLQSGWTRDDYSRAIDRFGDVEGWVTRTYKETFGVDPSPDVVAEFSRAVRAGEVSRVHLRDWMKSLPAAALHANRPPAEPGPTPEDEDARAYIDSQLRLYGLESLSGWAWEQIQDDRSPEWVLQQLRERPEYKQRFPAMDARRANGLPAISEAQYIAYENQVREVMRRNGMPPGFWDQTQDFTNLLANDLSPDEVAARVEKGWRRVMDAPPEVRAAFGNIYGVSGDAALAAWFIDPNKAEPVLERQAEVARTVGFGDVFGFNVGQARAEEILNFGRTSDQVVDAYSRLGRLTPLFSETVTETRDLTAEGEGLNAELGMDATSEAVLERRGRTRVAATSGGGGAAITQQGVSVGAAD